jgi:hypothetical protein
MSGLMVNTGARDTNDGEDVGMKQRRVHKAWRVHKATHAARIRTDMVEG